MNQYYVYAHVDRENNVPFYIGIGKGKRAFDKSRNDFWTAFVEKYANDYEVKFLAENISQDIAFEIENYFIKKFGKIHNDGGILLNWTDGGYAEGTYITISFEENKFELENDLTEYGKKLLNTTSKEMNIKKVKGFLNDIIEDKAIQLRQIAIVAITKKSKPIKPWLVPFCLSEQIMQNDKLQIKATSGIDFLNKLNQPIRIEMLPKRLYVDFFIHRIMIYFDLIIQENVWLEKNGNKVSKSNPDWHFYKDYWKGYVKIIQAINNDLELEIKYFGKNGKEHGRNDIYDFEIKVN